MVKTDIIRFSTSGTGDIKNLTDKISDIIQHSQIKNGTVTVFAPGSTTGITTIEYEPGLIEDFPEIMEKLIPSNKEYKHDQTWHDGNGFSHLRSAIVGVDITVPIVDSTMTLGTWQQIIFIEFDNRSRERHVVIQIMGE